MSDIVFVVEVSPTVSDDGSTSTFLFATRAFTTGPADTPPNTPVRGLLKNPGTVRRELFNSARVTGAITPSYGNIVLANPAPVEDEEGELDGWLDYGISGSRVVVRMGHIGDAYPGSWTTVYIAYAQSMVADLEAITIRLRDRLQLLDKPVVNEGFTGTGGIEGNGGVSKRKQFVCQDPGLIPPILVDANRLIYFVQSTGAGSFFDMYLWNAVDINPFDVFDNGVEITRQAPNYTSAAELLAATPSAGNVRYWFGADSQLYPGSKNGPVYFRLGSPPDGDLRVWAGGYPNDDDFTRLGVVYGSHTAGVMALRAGLAASDLDASSHTLNMLQQLIDDDRTYLDALGDAALCTQGFFGFSRLDKFRSGYLLDPESRWFYYGVTPGVISGGEPTLPTTSVYTFTMDNVKGLRREPPAGMEAPIWNVTINSGQTWPSQIAGGASTEMKDYLTREPYWTSVQGVSTTALLANPGAGSASVELKPRVIQNGFAARLMVERYLALFGGRRDFYTFSTPMTDETLALELHDVVTLQVPRFGLSAGKKFRIVGITLDCSSKVPQIKFILWGGETGRYTGHTGGPGTPGYQPPGTTAPPPSTSISAARNTIGLFTGWMAGTVSIETPASTGCGDLILLCHFDDATLGLNEAPYFHDFADVSNYDQTATAAFGSNAMELVTGSANQNYVYLNGSYANIGLAFNGDATIDFRMRRPGGLQSTGLGNSECSFFYMELWFSDGDAVYMEFGYFGTDFVAQRQGAGFRVMTENGPSGTTIYRETGYGWTDNDYHAIRMVIEDGDKCHCYVDGDFKVTISIGPMATTGTTLDYIVWNGGKTFPTTTDALQFDELRVLMNVAASGATDYTPATSAYTAACGDATATSRTEIGDFTGYMVGTVTTAVDTYFGDVELLLHFDGTNGSTTFTDSSAAARTVSVYSGSPVLTTSNLKFGSAGGSFPGSGAAITAGTGLDFTGDFTVECWLKYSDETTSGQVLWAMSGGTALTYFYCVKINNGTNSGIGFSCMGTQLNTATYPMTAGTWYHVAVVRSGTTAYIFIDGVQIDTGSISADVPLTSREFLIGDNATVGNELVGQLDDLRVTIGTARYTTGFTPPTSAFPDA